MKKILLCIDDERLVLSALRRSLRNEPFETLVAEGPVQAMKILEVTQPDAVLCDFRMPVMNGHEMLKWIHDKYPKIRLAILTGYEEPQMDANDLRIPRWPCLSKPWEESELKSFIAELMKE